MTNFSVAIVVFRIKAGCLTGDLDLTNLNAIAPNRDCSKPVILKFKTFICNSNGKIIYFFLNVWATLHRRGKSTLFEGRNFLTLVFLERAPQNTQN